MKKKEKTITITTRAKEKRASKQRITLKSVFFLDKFFFLASNVKFLIGTVLQTTIKRTQVLKKRQISKRGHTRLDTVRGRKTL